MLHELAGKPAPPSILVDVPRLIQAYFNRHPDGRSKEQRVSFGTSGHRGTSLQTSFNEDHILAVSQAICDYRRSRGVDGPLFLGRDTHALSEPAQNSAIEVLGANDVELRIAAGFGYTPTPVISHAILQQNRDRNSPPADGIVITPSHNPPEDGGFKYNPPHGGPAETEATLWIEERANRILEAGGRDVRRIPLQEALARDSVRFFDYLTPYVSDLENVVDLEVIRRAALRIGVDPMGGAGVAYWDPIRERYGLDLTVVNQEVDPTFSFMTVDWDGKIRMDCSSSFAMAGLIAMSDRFDLSFGNDPDVDRHGIVTPGGGLMNPNHFLAAAVDYLFRHRTGWGKEAVVGKTLVSSSLIDRVARGLGRRLIEVPVGFKWFVGGLLEGSIGFGGEESAGASFLRHDGTVWTTDKDGFILGLLAAEMTARTGQDPGKYYQELAARYGASAYERIDAPATPQQKAALKNLAPEQVSVSWLAGEPVRAILTRAPDNGAPIGGLKVVAENGWFAARPSGTENVYKIYAESFRGGEHLRQIQQEAQQIVQGAFARAGLT